MSAPATSPQPESSPPCTASSPMMPYAQYAECADQHAKNQAHFGARAATAPAGLDDLNGITEANNIPLNTLMAVDVSLMTGADVYIALTSDASAGIAVLADADAGGPSAAATTNGDVSSVSSDALRAETIDAKDNVFAVENEEPVDGPLCSHAPEDIPLNIYKPDISLHMMSLSADDLVVDCGHISRLEERVMRSLRAVNLEVPNVQHIIGTGIGQLYGERNILTRFLKRRDVGRSTISGLTTLEVKVRVLQRQTSMLLADVELLARNIDNARATSGGVVRRAKRDHKCQVTGPY